MKNKNVKTIRVKERKVSKEGVIKEFTSCIHTAMNEVNYDKVSSYYIKSKFITKLKL